MRPTPIPPGPGQESVWDYPRPPRVERTGRLVEVEVGVRVVASTTDAWRVLETSHPPTYYLPREAFEPGTLRETHGATWCEWKGSATYYDLVTADGVARRAAWSYLRPAPGYEVLAGAVAVNPAQVDRCTVDGQQVEPQAGGFYGGWITTDVVGPFKGAPGTAGW